MASFVDFAPYVAGTVAGLLAFVLLRQRPGRPLPPGPKPLPVIGNLLDMPKEKEWLTYQAWNDKYGDVVCVNIFGQKIVILGSATAVEDLMEKRGTIYSGRPSTPMLDLIRAQWAFVFSPYGEVWRRKRKLLNAHVAKGVAGRYHPIQVSSARRLARDILATTPEPEALQKAVKLNFAQMVVKAGYGLDVEGYESEYISLPEQYLDVLSEVSTPGRFFVDFLPILRHLPAWFPGAGFQRLARGALETQRRALGNPMEVVKAQMAEGTAPTSMAQAMLEEHGAQPPQQEYFEMVKEVIGVAYLAGTDTTGTPVLSFFLAMLLNPDVQKKAQAEVDRIVGADRLPEIEDRKDMPYIEALVNELFRWLPVLPMGVPRRTTQDDEYKGYFIPKGTIVMGSAWSILQNADDYPEPERFNPERFLTPDGRLDPSVRDPRTAAFGWGRRICPGLPMADASLFATVATLLATIDVVRAKDAQGNELIPGVDVSSGTLTHPKPFPWAVRARSRHAEELLASTST